MPAPHPESLGSVQVIGYVLLDLVVILVAARAVGAIFARMGQPRLVGEIVSGVLIGPTLLGGHLARAGISALDRPAVAGEGLVNDLFPLQSFAFLNLLATLFLVLFMFLVGLEVRRRYFKGHALKAGLVAIAIVAVPVGIGFLLATALDTVGTWKAGATPEGRPVPFPTHALFIGAGLAMTAFPLVGRNLQRKRILGTRMGKVGFAAAVAAMPLTFIIVGTASISIRQQGVPASVALKFLLAIALVAVLFAVVRPLLRLIFARFDRGDDRLSDALLALLVVGALASGLAADRIGIHALTGGLIFGACVPPIDGLASRVLERLRGFTVFFGIPVFLAVIGLQADFGVLDWGILGGLLVFLVASVLGKWGVGAVAGRAVGLRWREAGTVGLLANCRGLMILVVGFIALQSGVIAPAMLVAFITAAVVTTLMTGPLLDVLIPADTVEVRREGSIKRMLAGLSRNAEGKRIVVAPVIAASAPAAFIAGQEHAAEKPRPQFLVAALPGLEEEGDYVGAGPGEVEAVTRAGRRLLDPGADGLHAAGAEVSVGCYQSPDPAGDLVTIAETWGASTAVVGADEEAAALNRAGVDVERVGVARG